MNKKLQSELLKYIKESNDKFGDSYTMVYQSLISDLAAHRRYNIIEIKNNLLYMMDTKEIEGNIEINNGWLRVTAAGLRRFEPWYKKLRHFVINNFVQIIFGALRIKF